MQNILVAFDGTEAAHRALDTGIQLATRFEASLDVVSVIPVHKGRSPVDPWDDRPEHDRQLAEARAIVASRGLTAALFEPGGDPATTIERIAERGHYDTIVVGSRGSGSLTRWLQGSVSEHVATHADATVVVVR